MEDEQDNMKFGNVDFTDLETVRRPPFKHRRTPIIVTLSNAAQITPVDLQKMMEAGMNVARFKISHSTSGDKLRLLGKIDKAAATCCSKYGVNNWPVATCIDLKTCIVTTGLLEEEVPYVTLKEGSEVILTCNIAEYNKCNSRRIFIDNHHLVMEVKVGMLISIAADRIILRCTGIVDDMSIKCVVIESGNLTNMCIVCVKGLKRTTRPLITKKDLQIIQFAMENQVDVVTINYVRHPDTIKKAKQFMGKKIKRPIILSGISCEQGLNNFDEILQESDGIILAREFLPYELESHQRYRITTIQKWLSARCQQAGKPFYISGGVFQGSLATGEFNDNEIADVTNALLDGVTGFILRDCDDIDNVIESIHNLNEICLSVEPFTSSTIEFWKLTEQIKMPVNAAEACVLSCAAVANQTNSRAIVLPTVTGRTAKALLWMRPVCLILAVCNNIRITRLLKTYRCAVPLLYHNVGTHKKWHQAIEARVDFAIEYAVKRRWLDYGDLYVTLQRGSEGSSFCDMVRVWTVTISKKPLVECDDDGDINDTKDLN